MVAMLVTKANTCGAMEIDVKRRRKPRYKKAPNWTVEELELVRKWQAERVPGREQANRLGRTYSGWKTAVGNHGLGNCKFWTAKEVLKLKQWQEEGVPGEEQARRLGRPYFAWKNAVRRYKFKSEYTRYDPYLRATIMEMLSLGYSQADVVRRRNMKAHTSVSRITQELIKQGLLVKISRGKYAATKKWAGERQT